VLVNQTRRLSVEAIVLGILEASREGGPFGPQYLTNLAFREIARKAGIQRPQDYGRHDVRAFSDRCVATFMDLRKADPSAGDQQFVLFWDGTRYRVRPFGVTGAFQLDEPKLPDGGLWVARGNAIEPETRFSRDAIEMLEELINGGAPEVAFQTFFEMHPEFLLTLGHYVGIHPQLILHSDEGRRLIPDFFLERLNSDFCDICDLKRADVDLVRHQRNRTRFRDAVMEAVAQLSVYRDFFEERENRKAFSARYGLSAFRPRVVMIIGRQASFIDDVQRMRLESGLPGWVGLSTYDDVLASAQKWRTLASSIPWRR